MKAEVESRDLWAARLEVVGELASLINTTFDLDQIFRTAILKLRRVLPFRRASVALVSEDRSYYYLHTLYDAAHGGFITKDETYSLDLGLTGRAIRTGGAFRVDEFSGTEGIRAPGEAGVSALIVPLQLENQVIGTLNFGAERMASYTDEDLELAVLLGRQIATSLHYSKLLATIEEQRGALVVEHERVASERTRLEALIDASDAAILMVSRDRVAYANQAMADLLGLPREVILGSPMGRIDALLVRAMADPQALAAQQAALCADGAPLRDRVEFGFPRRLVCQRTVAAVGGGEGEPLGHLVLYRDVTREAEAEAAKSEFVSLVSHELRTPLTSVKTSLNLVMRGAAGTISDKIVELLEIALRNLDRLIRLVDDLLDLARIEAGRVELKPTSISTAEATRQAVRALEGFARERAVTLEVSDVPGTLVVADADRLQQVIVNLVSNAIKFSPPAGTVGLRWAREDGTVVLEISDQGAGIPAEQLATIFDKFRQLERSATRKYGGAGLGLAISRTLVDQMGGALWVESEEGQGSRFYVRLRLAEATRGRRVAPPIGGRSLLLVEGNAELRQRFCSQFEGAGWDVVAASRGDEALERTLEDGVDVVVAGVELEDMQGLEFLQQLRALPTMVDTPALLVGPGSDAHQAVAFGADGWVGGDAAELVALARQVAAAPRRQLVLIVEDDPAVRTGLVRSLRRAGYACLEATGGESALGMARMRAPDLVLTDIRMPGMDGLEVLRELRSDPGLTKVPVVVVTGHATPEAEKTIRELEGHFLPKPFGSTAVLREIERLIGAPTPAS